MARNRASATYEIRAVDRSRAVIAGIRRRLGSLSSSILGISKRIGALTGIASALSLGGIALIVSKSREAIDSLGKLSTRMGVSTQDLAGFGLQSELTGTSLETLVKSSSRLSAAFADILAGKVNDTSRAISGLGITVKDLQKVSNDTTGQLALFADRFAELPPGAERLAIAYKILGNRSTELIPLLSEGGDGLRRSKIEAQQFGLALSKDAVKGVEKANDSLTRLSALFRGVRDQIVSALAPAFDALTTKLKDFALKEVEAAGGAEVFAKNLAVSLLNALRSVSVAIVKLISNFRLLKAEFIDGKKVLTAEEYEAQAQSLKKIRKEAFAARKEFNSFSGSLKQFAQGDPFILIKPLFSKDELSAVDAFEQQERLFGILTEQQKRFENSINPDDFGKETIDSINQFFDGLIETTNKASPEVGAAVSGLVKQFNQPIAVNSGAAKAAIDKQLEELKRGLSAEIELQKSAELKQLEAYERRRQIVVDYYASVGELTLNQEKSRNALIAGINNEQIENLRTLNANTLEELSLAYEAQRNALLLHYELERTLTEEQELLKTEQLATLEQTRQDKLTEITADAAKRQAEIQRQALDVQVSAYSGFAKSSLTLLSAFGKKSFKTQKKFAIADSIINIIGGVVKALNNPYPANLGFAASVAAAGASLLTTLKSKNPSSSTVGGNVSGGSSSSSGPLPTGSNDSDFNGQNSAQTAPQEITLTLVGKNHDSEDIVTIIERLNEASENGYKLNANVVEAA